MNKDDKPKLVETKDEWYQENDCCDSGCGQVLEVWTQDGGGGNFICIKTDRWAIDDIDAFCKMLKSTLKRVEDK